MTVAALFVRQDSIYKHMPGVDAWDIERDARRWPGGSPVIAHPPCRGWGKLSYFAKPRSGELELGPWAVAQVVAVADEIPEADLLHAEEGAHDPHVWFDPTLWTVAAERAARALAELDPAHAADYAKGLAEMQRDLVALDATVTAGPNTLIQDVRFLCALRDASVIACAARYGDPVELLEAQVL